AREQQASAPPPSTPGVQPAAPLKGGRRPTPAPPPADLSCAPSSASAWLPPTNPTAAMPAAVAALTPAGESSITIHSAVRAPMREAACRNRSGAGLPFGTSVAENKNLKNLLRPVISRLSRIRPWGEDDATHFGPRSQVSAWAA